MTKIEQATKYKTNYITFIYANEPSKTTNNLDIAISILDADHAKIKKIVWNGTTFTVEELLESNF